MFSILSIDHRTFKTVRQFLKHLFYFSHFQVFTMVYKNAWSIDKKALFVHVPAGGEVTLDKYSI